MKIVGKKIMCYKMHTKWPGGCDANIYNQGNEPIQTYSSSNLGSGEQVYYGSQITGDNTDFQFKTLKSGTGISLSSDDNEITITGTSNQTYSATNLGSGNVIYAGSTSIGDNTQFSFKTLTAGANTTITNNLNEVNVASSNNTYTFANLGLAPYNVFEGLTIVGENTEVSFKKLNTAGATTITSSDTTLTISSPFVSTGPWQVTYNYMHPVTVDYTAAYLSTSTLVTATVQTPNPRTEGTISIINLNSFTFTPAPRLQNTVIIPVYLIFADSRYVTLTIKLSPNLTNADDTTADWLLGAGKDGILYKINNNTNTITEFLNYDGTSIGLGVLNTIAMNQLDNILFYTLPATSTTIRYYDMVTKVGGTIVTNVFGSSGWTSGATIASLTFDQVSGVLYAIGDTNGAVIRAISIAPFNRSVGLVISAAAGYASIFPSVAGNVQQSIAIDRFNKTMSGVVKPSAGDSQVRSSILSTTSATIAFENLVGDAAGIVVVAASGRVYIFGKTTLQFRRTPGGRNIKDYGNTFVSAINFNDLSVISYGS